MFTIFFEDFYERLSLRTLSFFLKATDVPTKYLLVVEVVLLSQLFFGKI